MLSDSRLIPSGWLCVGSRSLYLPLTQAHNFHSSSGLRCVPLTCPLLFNLCLCPPYVSYLYILLAPQSQGISVLHSVALLCTHPCPAVVSDRLWGSDSTLAAQRDLKYRSPTPDNPLMCL